MASADQLKALAKQKAFSRVDVLNSLGITGYGINAANLETPGLADKHCESCTKRYKDAAPESNVYEIGATITTAGSVKAICHYDGIEYDLEDFISKFNIRILIKSTGGKAVDAEKSAYWQRLIDKYNLILVCVPGNNAEEGYGGAFPADVSIYVGGCAFNDKGVIKLVYYSTDNCPYIKFVNFVGYLNGMSFAAPYTAGMIALILQVHPEFTRQQVIDYLIPNCYNLLEKGWDDDSGYGVPVLKNLENEGDEVKKKIVLQINNLTMTVGGVTQTLDQAPVILSSGRTMIPLRAVLEALGNNVTWEPVTKTVTING